MRVCLVIGSLRAGGAERVAVTMANHWAAGGWAVSLVTLASEAEDFYVLSPEVERRALQLEQQSAGWVSAVLRNCQRLRALRRTLRALDPEIVLGFLPSVNVLCALARPAGRSVVIGSEHVHPPSAPPARPWAVLRRVVYPRLSALSAPTEDTAEWFRTRLPTVPVHAIPNPVAFPLPRAEPVVPPSTVRARLKGDLLLLAVGRLHWQKGFDLLLEAFHRLRGRQPRWSLVILGEGPEREALEAQTQRLGLGSCVAMPGAVGNAADWYENADAFVMSSRFEGFGNTLAEALAHGLPAVAADCRSGPRDILRHGVDGLLVPSGDAVALESGLDRLLGDHELRADCARRAGEARERFSPAVVSARWESVFREVRPSFSR